MKIKALRDKTAAELRQQEQEIAEQLFALRLQKVTGQLEKPHRVRALKRDLARVMTVLNEQSA